MPTVAVYAHLLRERPWVTRDRRRAIAHYGDAFVMTADASRGGRMARRSGPGPHRADMTATDRVHRDHGPSPRGSVLLVGNYLLHRRGAGSPAAQEPARRIAGDGGEYSTVFASRACHEVWRHDPSRAPGVFLGERRLAHLAPTSGS
ncbi:MAG: hypothetical protein U0869_01075 [Chloroflexota bacterium]